MKKLNLGFSLMLVICCAVSGLLAQAQGQAQRARRVYTTEEVRRLVATLVEHSQTFRGVFSRELARTELQGTRREENLDQRTAELEQAIKDLSKILSDSKSHESAVAQVARVLYLAQGINDSFRAPLTAEADHNWDMVRADLNALALAYNYRPLSWSANDPTYARAEVNRLIQEAEVSGDRFEAALDRALDRTVLDDTPRADRINQIADQMEDALDRLRNKFNLSEQYEEARAEVALAMEVAQRIEPVLSRTAVRPEVQSEWMRLRSDLNELAYTYYLPPLPR